jgi:hypothetical protein
MDWVRITDEEGEAEYYTTGTRVASQHSMLRRDGTEGVVIGWGRGVRAHEHWTAMHEPIMTCPFGMQCDALVDSEGPLIRWDDQDPGDETIDWFPGQAMSCLRPLSPDLQ